MKKKAQSSRDKQPSQLSSPESVRSYILTFCWTRRHVRGVTYIVGGKEMVV